MPSPVSALTGQQIVSPPQSSGASSSCWSCCLTRSTFAAGRSILLMATMMVTPAALACWMASRVWGMMPSSAATISTAMSVRLAPAGAHGGERLVARRIEKGDVLVLVLHRVGADVLGDAPDSSSTTFALRIRSSSEVLPWST